ncbi:helix-turn-helix domain-containing protein (plasmid) [Bacillus thuringiensis]|nr:helix-turn-helix domain-containing protein [Bacillus thuringiensis]QFQ28454.1 helix-turn-helix domain-containing protein [Bacillus thuringiensis]
MAKKAHYPAEIKWKVVEMKHQGFKNKEIMDALGIRHVAQIKTWMKWYLTINYVALCIHPTHNKAFYLCS